MPTDKVLRVFNVEDQKSTKSYKVKDYYINQAYGECSTSASVAAKTVELINYAGWVLKSGSRVTVKFSNAVTGTPTLNVNNTGAKDIWLNGSAVGSAIHAGDIAELIYDGTRYCVLAIDRASKTMTGATASSSGSDGLVPAPVVGDNDKFLGGDGTWKTPLSDEIFSVVNGKLCITYEKEVN